MSAMLIDSLIYSVTYENYQKNILQDKINKTQGAWKISDQMLHHLQYAYVYLKDSDGMIVKRYEIDKFEKADPSKGYEEQDKYCFIFKSSKDVFFEYPYSRVQARHYRLSSELDNLPSLSESEIGSRLNKSKNIDSEPSRKSKGSGVLEPAKEQLVKIRNEKFNDRPMPSAEIARGLITRVEAGEDADAVLTEYYFSLTKDKLK